MINQFQTPSADLQRQYDLLQMEYEYEKETYRQQAERVGIHRKIQQGLCWYPVIPGKSYYNSLNQLVIEIERRDDKEIEHNFEYGRPVCFFTTNGIGSSRYLNFSFRHLLLYSTCKTLTVNWVFNSTSTRQAIKRCSMHYPV